MDEAVARRELVGVAQRLDALGHNVNSSGNLSVRVAGGLLVTPSGIPAADLVADDMVPLDDAGEPIDAAGRRPTSEWRLHVEILRRRHDVGAIVHTHSVEATAAAVTGTTVPPIHYVAARFGGGGLRCAPYHTYGTAELASAVADTLDSDGHACLMANHGAIALGADLTSACALVIDVEWFCAVHRRAVALGDPVVLDAEEIDRVARLFATYGQPSD